MRVKDGAIAFAGETGKGKSTLAASFHTAGFHLLTDDGLVVAPGDNYSFALPVYPGLRLWPQSVAALLEKWSPGSSVSHYSEKQRIKLQKEDGLDSVKLSSLYMLISPNSNDDAGSISVTRLSPRDACLELMRNSFQLDVNNIQHLSRLLAETSAVAEQLPVFSLSYPRDFSRLPEVHEAILQHFNPDSESFDNKE